MITVTGLRSCAAQVLNEYSCSNIFLLSLLRSALNTLRCLLHWAAYRPVVPALCTTSSYAMHVEKHTVLIDYLGAFSCELSVFVRHCNFAIRKEFAHKHACSASNIVLYVYRF